MRCPYCGDRRTEVVKTVYRGHSSYRHRRCSHCGSRQVVIARPSGEETEIWSTSSGLPTITGTNADGSVSRPTGGSITMPSPAWLSPSLLTQLISGSEYKNSYIGSEMRNGVKVQHVAASQTPDQGSSIPSVIAQQQANTHCDVYLDPATSLPVSMVFQVRPYHKPGAKPLSIRAQSAAEEVRYSDYRQSQGRDVPYHIQVYLDDAQFMDIIVSSITINSGATIVATQ